MVAFRTLEMTAETVAARAHAPPVVGVLAGLAFHYGEASRCRSPVVRWDRKPIGAGELREVLFALLDAGAWPPAYGPHLPLGQFKEKTGPWGDTMWWGAGWVCWEGGGCFFGGRRPFQIPRVLTRGSRASSDCLSPLTFSPMIRRGCGHERRRGRTGRSSCWGVLIRCAGGDDVLRWAPFASW